MSSGQVEWARGSVCCSSWRWRLCLELLQASGCASINAIPPSTQDLWGNCMEKLPGVHHALHWVLCSVIYSALSSGNPRVLLLRMTPNRCYNPAWPCSSSASSPSPSANVPLTGTRCRATWTKGVFVSTDGVPNLLWLLHRSPGCASQGNAGAWGQVFTLPSMNLTSPTGKPEGVKIRKLQVFG